MSWVRPLPPDSGHLLIGTCAFFAVMQLVGLATPIATFMVFITFSWLFLICESNHNSERRRRRSGVLSLSFYLHLYLPSCLPTLPFSPFFLAPNCLPQLHCSLSPSSSYPTHFIPSPLHFSSSVFIIPFAPSPPLTPPSPSYVPPFGGSSIYPFFTYFLLSTVSLLQHNFLHVHSPISHISFPSFSLPLPLHLPIPITLPLPLPLAQT